MRDGLFKELVESVARTGSKDVATHKDRPEFCFGSRHGTLGPSSTR